ncbi:uncharacterized protein M6B38_116095 [Iris pallida]|uniref:Uncharacterized protein n=1 Tax=Iris pallida TaxID=29817 RepID=A0AAX6I559_IRIPA|nr:uncharacterized protein M6B38_116095 [Iris pallida]
MEMEAAMGSGYGGEAIYCVIILWLSLMSLIMFNLSGGGDDAAGTSRRRRRTRGSPVFIGAEKFCDGTGSRCDGGYGVCCTCT